MIYFVQFFTTSQTRKNVIFRAAVTYVCIAIQVFAMTYVIQINLTKCVQYRVIRYIFKFYMLLLTILENKSP